MGVLLRAQLSRYFLPREPMVIVGKRRNLTYIAHRPAAPRTFDPQAGGYRLA